ncbi:MAG: cation transporter [Deltaproteobacteria bacterium]|nr:cation transporter [Deltaproteobacteria bacterium]MBW2070599.1 cation transporter [Deltaproteobacteria bacterium]
MTNRTLQSATPVKAMALAFVVSCLLTSVKFVAYAVTGSTAVLSDAFESIINVVAGGFALFSTHLSSIPADRKHPYGHGKIEYFSVGFEGALIALASMAILARSIPEFFHERQLTNLEQGIFLIVAASAVNFFLGWFLIRTGRKNNSDVLIADGKHLLTDVYTSGGVLVGLVLVRTTGAQWWDPAIACLVAVNILYTGWRLLSTSFGRLMDQADPDLLSRIVAILNRHRQPEWIDIHHLRARRYGRQVSIDFHLILPRSFSLVEAHSQAKEIERVLVNALGEIGEVIVHLDPCDDPFCPKCQRHSCADRTTESLGLHAPWRVEDVVAEKLHHD